MTLLKPVITEKSIRTAGHSVFTFEVSPGTTKTMARELVQRLFKVHVTKVTVRRTHLPAKRTGTKRLPGSPGSVKSATVWLKPGENISLFDLKDQSAQGGKK